MAVVWLAVILILILGTSRLVRLLPLRLRQATPQAGQEQGTTLILRGSIALDLRRRVYLVEAAGQSALILTGGTTDLILAIKAGES